MAWLRRWARFATQPVGYGLIGAVLIYLALGVVQVFAVPLFQPDDEPRHAAYALVVAEGRIPDITERVPVERLGIEPLPRTNIMVAAVHPPLYYAIVGPPILAGSKLGLVGPAMFVARLLTLLMGLGGLVYAWRIARILVPDRPDVATLTVAFMGLFPSFVNYNALVHNEALAFTASCAILFHVIRPIVDGPSRRDLAWLALWAAIAALTRFSGLLVLAPALLGLLVAHAAHGGDPLGRRLLRGVLAGGAVLLAVLGASGWFYAHNWLEYGDVTGATRILSILDREPRAPAIVHVFSLKPWRILHDDLWGRLGGIYPLMGSVSIMARIWTAGAVVGLGLAAWRHRSRWRDGWWRSPRAVALGIGLLALAAVTAPVFQFYASGGLIYPRYYFPVLWLPALAAAVGWSAWRSPAMTAWATVYGAVLSLVVLVLYVDTLHGVAGEPRDLGLTHAMAVLGAPGSRWLVAALLGALAAAVVLVLRSVQETRPPPSRSKG